MTDRMNDRFPSVMCPRCGKYGYPNRRTARRAAKHKHPNDRALRAYECNHGTGYWHIGHQYQTRDFYRRAR